MAIASTVVMIALGHDHIHHHHGHSESESYDTSRSQKYLIHPYTGMQIVANCKNCYDLRQLCPKHC